MKNVLIISCGGLIYDGITSVIYNYCNNMNRDGINFTFLAYSNIPKEINDKFKKIGNIIIVPNRKKDLKNYIKSLKQIMTNNYFDVVHIHGNSFTMLIEASLAKKSKVKKIIVHSHSTNCDHPFLNKLFKNKLQKKATNLIACSKKSGEWLYGKSNYIILNNAIDIDNFTYKEDIRKKIRNTFNINDKDIVLGHVGHFTIEKNHKFLLDIFKEYHKINNNSKLLLIGEGPLFETIKNTIYELNLQGSVLLLGKRKDVNDIYQAMDIFVLPSLWEGLPLVMIEAQSPGLPCLVSSNVTEDAKCIEQVYYDDLSKSDTDWANDIQKIINKKFDRNINTKNIITKKGFNITKEAELLRKIYIE